jgi:DNA polymerase III subunit epsilon
MNLDFTAVDVETANRQRGSICAVGLSKVRNGLILQSASWLVDPPGGRTFEAVNVSRNGITAVDIGAALSWAESLTAIMDFCDEDVIAHHSMFDIQALSHACQLSGLPTPGFTSIDTQALAKAFLPNQKAGLEDVSGSLGLPEFKHHDAEADAVACARIVIELALRHGGLDRLLSSVPLIVTPPSEHARLASRVTVILPSWIRKKIEEMPYSHENHNAWLDLVLAHPDGRAQEGTPCIGCGSPIEKRTNFKYKDRHCCPKCSDKLKKSAKRYADSLGLTQPLYP